MRLENLYENFGLATPEAQAEYITNYRLLRAEDMAKPSTYNKKKSTSSTATPKVKLQLTEEEQTLMELLGLKKKDVVALRALYVSEDEEEIEESEDEEEELY